MGKGSHSLMQEIMTSSDGGISRCKYSSWTVITIADYNSYIPGLRDLHLIFISLYQQISSTYSRKNTLSHKTLDFFLFFTMILTVVYKQISRCCEDSKRQRLYFYKRHIPSGWLQTLPYPLLVCQWWFPSRHGHPMSDTSLWTDWYWAHSL